jgi:hypothetical protein
VAGGIETVSRRLSSRWGQRLVVERHLIAADRTPVGRIEGDDHRLAGEVAEAQALIGGHVQREIRSLGAGTQKLGLLLSLRRLWFDANGGHE